MKPVARACCAAFTAFALTPTGLWAQEETPAVADELAALRETVQAQNVRIDALTRAVERLTAMMMGGAKYQEPVVLPSEVHAAPPVRSAPAAAPPVPAEPVATPAAPLPPASGNVHEVAAGENLTLIAKKYGVGIGALMQLNQIKDAKKLQVGQILQIPAKDAPPLTP